MHRVVILVMDNVVPLDLGIGWQVFDLAKKSDGSKAYQVELCAPEQQVQAAGFLMHVPYRLERLELADTIIIPGSEDPLQAIPAEVSQALQQAFQRGARLASICSGAFILAASGVLNGKHATTHWRFAEEFARKFTEIIVEPNVLFVDEGNIVTSAGASAGLDMCLHLVQRDYGQSVAANTARLTVSPLYRDGGQAQFIRQELPTSPASLQPLLEWLKEHVHLAHTVETLAKRANMSPRNFARKFQEQTGTTPLQWLLSARIDRARELLEAGEIPIEKIANLSGFASAVTFRARFRHIVGLTPTEYRRRFSSSHPAAASPVTHCVAGKDR